MTLHAMRYYGGKSVIGKGIGKWVVENLPTDHVKRHYIELFGGMCGVLLQKTPSKMESVNDLNSRVMNWWEVIRDKQDEYYELLRRTPAWSEEGYRWAWENVDTHESAVYRALAIHIILYMSYKANDGTTDARMPEVGPVGIAPRWYDKKTVDDLARRMQKVHLFNRDALELFDKYSRHENNVIYLDPPYMSTYIKAYKEKSLDVEGMVSLCKEAKADVVISGYGDEWDATGFDRLELDTTLSSYIGKHDEGQNRKRTEVLWRNYSNKGSLLF